MSDLIPKPAPFVGFSVLRRAALMGGCCTKCVSFWRLPDDPHAPNQHLKSQDYGKRSTSELPLPPIVHKSQPAAHQWVRFKDDLSQSIFWHNAATGETLSDENFPPKKPILQKDYKPPSPPSSVDTVTPKTYRPPSPPPLDSDDELEDQDACKVQTVTQDRDHITDSAAQAAFIHLKLRLSNEIATNLSLGGNQGRCISLHLLKL